MLPTTSNLVYSLQTHSTNVSVSTCTADAIRALSVEFEAAVLVMMGKLDWKPCGFAEYHVTIRSTMEGAKEMGKKWAGQGCGLIEALRLACE